MTRRLVVIAVAGFFVVGAALVVVVRHCGAPDDERAVVLGLLEAWAEAARKGDIKTLRLAVSRRYHDSVGRDRKAIDRFLMLQLLRRARINAVIVSKEVALDAVDEPADAPAADAIVKIILRRGSSVRALNITLSLRKEEGDAWRVTSATWRDINVEDVTKLRQ